jgi:hypothetical protein
MQRFKPLMHLIIVIKFLSNLKQGKNCFLRDARVCSNFVSQTPPKFVERVNLAPSK